jgi:hypothetical protein
MSISIAGCPAITRFLAVRPMMRTVNRPALAARLHGLLLGVVLTAKFSL